MNSDHTTEGFKEVREAVAIAALTALATGLINWGIETMKAKQKKAAEREKPDVTVDKAQD